MSLPMMLSMLINSLYNIIDSMFVARIGEDALTAVSLVYPLQTLVVSISVGFGVGINAAGGFFLGAGEGERRQVGGNGAASARCTARFVCGRILCILYFCLCLLCQDARILDWGNGICLYCPQLFYGDYRSGIAFEKYIRRWGNMLVPMVLYGGRLHYQYHSGSGFIFGLRPIPRLEVKGRPLLRLSARW